MSIRKVAATVAAAGAAGMGVGAYNAHEAANEARNLAADAEIYNLGPVQKAELQNIIHRKDIQTISLLGMAVLLGAGTAASYRASKLTSPNQSSSTSSERSHNT